MEYYRVPSKVRAVTEEDLMGLPRGFRFHPTDEEIVVHYLIPKALNSNFRAAAIGQADFNKCEPWDLPKKANMGDTERYYYCQRDRKYPSGLRTNRATKAGYWKATGKDKEIYKGVGAARELVGMKKTLVFYTGRAPNGEKTNWVMHEFRLQQNGQFISIPKDDGWVVSRVFNKISTTGGGNHTRTASGNSAFSPAHGSDSFSTDDLIIDNTESLPDLVDPSAVPSSSNASQDLKRKAAVSISYGYPHQSVNMHSNRLWHPNNSSIDGYNDDDQLIYSDDPDYYYASLSETLFQTLDSLGYENLKENKSIAGTTNTMINEYKCKVEQPCPSSPASSVPLQITSNNNVDVSSDGQEYDNFPLSSTLSSMQDLPKLWD